MLACCTAAAPAQEVDVLPPEVPFGSRIQRTMKLLATSTPKSRHRVKILFYGQSIIAQDWWKSIVAELQRRYPEADIVAENPSIGGFTAEKLKDTCASDLYPSCADLVIFHDYGSKEDFNTIYGELKKRTTAEMLTLTHHQAGEPGWDGGQGKESQSIKELADTYGYEVADVRKSWRNHLAKNKLPAKDFLKDVIHLNKAGEDLMVRLVLPHLVYLPDQKPTWNEQYQIFTPDGNRWSPAAEEYPAGGTTLKGALKVVFEGTRVDLLAMQTKDTKLGTARLLIDGKPPSAYPETYTFKRFGSFHHWWPVLRKIEIGGKPPLAEDWTLTITKIGPEGSSFSYDLKGSVTGADGQGTSDAAFTSTSGRVRIDPQWFTVAELCKMTKKVPDPGFAIKTKLTMVGTDTWAPKAGLEVGAADGVVVVQGLANRPHTLEILPNGDGPLPLRAIVARKPSLK